MKNVTDVGGLLRNIKPGLHFLFLFFFQDFKCVLYVSAVLFHHLFLVLLWQDGTGWDPDARWLLCRRHMGAEDACHRPPQGRVSESHWGNPHRWSYAQTCGEARYMYILLSLCRKLHKVCVM